MCSIVCTKDVTKLPKFVEENLYRGQSNYSLSEYNYSIDSLIVKFRKSGAVNLNDYKIKESNNKNIYYISHTQSPTGKASLTHPAYNRHHNSYLWHNGMILDHCMKDLIKKYYPEENYNWDTKLFVDLLSTQGFNILSQIDGSFACVLRCNSCMYIFRTTSAPLYINDVLDISSTKFDGSKEVTPGIVYRLNLYESKLEVITQFTCLDNPYIFVNNER